MSRNPPEAPVVRRHEVSVGRQLEIELHGIGSLSDGLAKARERVLGKFRRRAAVGEDERRSQPGERSHATKSFYPRGTRRDKIFAA
jgi:hypothetical protein